MVKGWWWIREPEELAAILTALNPRGIREKVLRKNLTKHMEFLNECCTQPMTGKSLFKRPCSFMLIFSVYSYIKTQLYKDKLANRCHGRNG